MEPLTVLRALRLAEKDPAAEVLAVFPDAKGRGEGGGVGWELGARMGAEVSDAMRRAEAIGSPAWRHKCSSINRMAERLRLKIVHGLFRSPRVAMTLFLPRG